MLVEAGALLGIRPRIFCGSVSEPAAQVSPNQFTLGSLSDSNSLAGFFGSVKQVLFESEFVSRATLESAAKSAPVTFYPDLSVVERVQNKLSQKKLFDELGLPTSDWVEVDARLPLEATFAQLQSRFPDSHGSLGYVLKLAEGGYDGKGNWLPGSSESAESFLRSARERKVQVYAEKKIAFARELALVSVRSLRGEWASYPAVISVQERGICRWVEGPAERLGVPESRTETMKVISKKLADHLGMVGTYAIEFFETKSGELLINEMAPRVHNSGHFTQDLCEASQFENHWRAVLGLSLGSTSAQAPFFGMWNSLGLDRDSMGSASAVSAAPLTGAGASTRAVEDGVWHHDYGKKDCRPGRKMGHWNLRANSEVELRQKKDRVSSADFQWLSDRFSGEKA